MQVWPDLRPVLGDTPWIIVGGVATRAYMPERSTQDLDILIRAADLPPVCQKLEAAGYSRITALLIPGVAYRSPAGVEVDVLTSDAPWLTEALAQPHYDGAGYPVLALPYLVLLKLAASRAQDLADLSRMLGLADAPMLAHIRQLVQRYAPEDAEDVASLIYLGQIESGKIPPEALQE